MLRQFKLAQFVQLRPYIVSQEEMRNMLTII
jgi:hypothetical protein